METIRSSVVEIENRILFSFRRINHVHLCTSFTTFASRGMHIAFPFTLVRDAAWIFQPSFSQLAVEIFVGYLNFDISMNFLARHE